MDIQKDWQNWTTTLFAGFYESYLYNSDTLYNVNQGRDDNDPELDIDDWDDYCKDVGAMCVDCLNEYIGDEHCPIKKLTFKGIASPKYYNFETDRLICDVEYDRTALIDYCFSKHRKEFDEYLKENFTSYDGFISFVPNNVAEFWQDRDDSKNIDVMIEFVLLDYLDADEYRDNAAEKAYEILWQHLAPVQDNEQGDDNDNNKNG